tara:strand:+ start:491 stop:1054 length:564 start_codon:yes stop_codon:yes gene_type:complete
MNFIIINLKKIFMNFTKFKKSNHSRSISLLMALLVLFVSWTPSSPGVVLKAGTNIPLETLTQISSSNMGVGQTIDFRVTRDILADGKTAIEAGSIAKGQIVRSQAPKSFGKPGFLEVKITSVTAIDGQEVYLAGGSLSEEGDDKATLAIVLGIFVCLLFLFIKGKDGIIPAGFSFNSQVATTVNIEA